MDWQKLFATHILKRGYDYYSKNAVENLDVSDDGIRADVIGTEDYEVEISLNNGKVIDMYCSCPYAADGRNCKHMAAVLYEWSENYMDENKAMETEVNTELFGPAYTMNAYRKKQEAVEKLVTDAKEEEVRSFLASVLVENEKLLLRFYNTVNKQVTKRDINNYIRQIDMIANRYLGKNRFISYYEAENFIWELEEIIDEAVRRIIDNGNYIGAFEVMNYIFVLIGDVDMDDSDGGTSMLADRIYQLWLELLVKVSLEEKRKMFDWFISHLDGSVMDYLEDYIESKHDTHKSYTTNFTNGNIGVDFEKGKVKLPKLKDVKAKLHREFRGKIKSVTVSQVPSGKYYVSILVETEHKELPHTNDSIGIDLGIKDICITSNGKLYKNQKNIRKYEKELTKLQRQLSHKEKRSKNYDKTKKKIALCHERIRNTRKDYLHKISHEIISENKVIVSENLQIKTMVKNRHLAKEISDVSWYELTRQLEYKAEWNGRKYIKIDRFYASSQICSVCGYQNRDTKDLSVRGWICPECGTMHDRDINAAKNILEEGLRQIA